MHKIYDLAFLTELIKFNHKGNFDRVMAFMIGMYHTRELYNAEVKDVLEDGTTDEWFERNFISGIFINTGVIFTFVVETKVNLIKFVRLWDMIKYRDKSSR